MSFGNDAIATTVISAEIVVNPAQIQSAAQQAAAQMNRAFNVGAGDAAVRLNQSLNRITSGFQTQIRNIQSGFSFLGNVIAARLPASAVSAANRISGAFGQAFGTIRQGLTQLNTLSTGVWNRMSSSAGAAAISVGAVAGVAVALTVRFAQMSDEAIRAEGGLRAVAAAAGNSRSETSGLIENFRELGRTFGVSSAQLIQTSQSFIAMGSSLQETEGLLNAVTIAGARMQASQQQISRVLVGLQQIQSKGVLSQQEFRQQILENIPGIFNQSRAFELMAQKLNITTDQVRKLQEEGQITADVALPAIQQAMEEMNESVDVLSIRMSSLSGLFGILRENFTQIIGTGFQSFIQSLSPTLTTFIDQIQKGTGPFANFGSSVSELGRIMGESFGQILQQIVPLLPQFFDMFVTATRAIAPVIVEIVKVFATLSKIVLPVIRVVVGALDILLNRLGPLSFVLRQLAAALVTGGVIKLLGLFGRAVGSAGGFIGRIATPLSNMLQGIGGLAAPIAKAVGWIGLLKDPVIDLANGFAFAFEKVSDFVAAVGRIPGISHAVDAVQAVGRAIGNVFSSTDSGKVGKIFEPISKGASDAQKALDNFGDTLESIVSKQNDIKKANDKVKDAQDAVTAAIEKRTQAEKSVQDAIDDRAEAEVKLTDINTKLAEKERERNNLINDTARDIRELAAAERDLERINMRLIDLDQERTDILEQIRELETPASLDEIAAANRKIERARIANNQAIRQQQEYLDSLNEAQQTNNDLQGLSLDDLRSTLAGLRLQAQAQRARGREGKSQEEINEQIALNQMDVLDTENALNEAIVDREELLNKVVDNQDEIRDLTENLRGLELDRLDILEQQRQAIVDLQTIRSGETSRARELRGVEDEIKTLRNDQRNAVNDINNLTINIKDRQLEVRNSTREIRDAENEVKAAKIQQRIDVATILGDQRSLNAALFEQIGHNNVLIGQSRELVMSSLLQNPNFINAFAAKNPIYVPGGSNIKPNASIIANILLNSPNAMRDLLRQLGVSGFEDGGMATHPMLANIGEKYKHEMILPMTKPDRVWQIMSQNLPKYPGALRAAQSAVGAAPEIPSPSLLSSGRRVQKRTDGPPTYGQTQELIALLREHRSEVHFHNQFELQSKGITEEAAVRKLSKQLKKELLDELNKRR